MFIPEDKIDAVRSASDIVEVVGEYVQLKRRGSNFVGLCPFHKEKTPSFNVNPGLGIYKCFGCGAGGNEFQFLMRVENLEFPEAVKVLAERANIVIIETDDQRQQSSEVESIYNALRFAGRFFYQSLTQEERGKTALDYLLNRGFTPETIKKFGLGYAPDGWDALLVAAGKENIDVQYLEKAGLIIPKKDGGGYYDRYRNRVIFPIFSHLSKVIGFGGRILKEEKKQPKYINSPETRVYHKGSVLYGLHQSKQAIRKREEVLLVEGYTDVISLFQAGVEHVVATSGTALTPDQIKLLKRYTQKVLVLYDSDSAGAAAALRGIDLLLAQGVTVYGLELPDGEDPDSFVRNHGADEFEKYMETKRMDFITFMHGLAKKSGQLDTPEGQGKLTKSIVNTIAIMPDVAMHEPFIRRASHVLGIPDIPLFEQLGKIRKSESQQSRSSPRQPAPAVVEHTSTSDVPPYMMDSFVVPAEEERMDEEEANESLPEERMLLRLMLDNGSAMVEYIMGNMALVEFSPGVVQSSIKAILSMYDEGKVDKHKLIDGSFGNGVRNLVTEVLMQRHELSKNWERKQKITVPKFNQDPFEIAAGTMTLLKLDRVKEAYNDLKKRIFSAERSGENVRLLLEEQMALQTLQKQIENREFLKWNT
ncbi:MAG: DNA primase [Rhodothermales bacterium]